MQNNQRHRRTLGFGLEILAVAGLALAQAIFSPQIGRFIAMGGGRSAGGQYVLIGVAGQGGVGVASGGVYQLKGGFLVGSTRKNAVSDPWLIYP